MKRIRIVGVINVSPESFYKDSVQTTERQIAEAGRSLAKAGADIIDVGAMSTAPYLKTDISELEEARRLVMAVRVLKRHVSLPLSVDTSRYVPAAAGLDAGADILNDVTGFSRDPRLFVLARHVNELILMAHPRRLPKKVYSPLQAIQRIFQDILRETTPHKIPRSKIILDPGIGFFRTTRWSWIRWDLAILSELEKLASWAPLLVGVSRKSFIGELTGQKRAADRLAGSLAATALAVYKGAELIRTHDAAETRDAAQIASYIRDFGRSRAQAGKRAT